MRKPNKTLMQQGFSMLEVLITIVIVSIALLGLASLQSKLTISQIETYQRAEAVVMLNDMVSKLNSARGIAPSVATATLNKVVGKSDEDWLDCDPMPADATLSLLCQWSILLKGSSEVRADGGKAGGPVGMVGCIDAIAGSNPPAYLVSVAWQGNTQSYVPALTCGKDLFGTEPAAAGGLGYRRVISSTVQFANLSGI